MITWKSWQKWLLIFSSLYIFLLFSNLIFPITFDDDFASRFLGENPFSVAWRVYHTWLGRYLTVLITTIIFQWDPFWTEAAASVIILLFFISVYYCFHPRFLSDDKKSNYLYFFLIFIVMYCFIPMSATFYGMTSFMSVYTGALVFILFFLAPYVALIRNQDLSPRFIWFSGICGGIAHEQGVAFIPLLLIIWLLLKWRKISIPKWFWLGFGFYCLGATLIVFAPANRNRLALGYGNPENWDFLGQTINWFELGWLRYFYSLAKIMIFDSINAYLPNTLAYYIFYFFLLWKVSRKTSFTDPEILVSVIYILASLGITSVMMFAPIFYQGNLMFGMIFLWLACFTLLKYYVKLFQARRFLFGLSVLLFASLVIIWGIQCKAWNDYRKEYDVVVSLIQDAKKANASQVEVPPFTQPALRTPFGKIYTVYLYRSPTFYTRMATYYNSPPIIVNDKLGGLYEKN